MSSSSGAGETQVKTHPSFPQPNDVNIKIWRYMDFTKLLCMLEHRGLYLSRLDRLGDSFEGSVPMGNERMRKEFLASLPTTLPSDTLFGLSRHYRRWIYASCWHMNEYESAAMWRLYAQTKEAIAVQSTYARLATCTNEETFLGVVRYIDYTTEWFPEGNIFNCAMHKRKSFEHEREVRLVRLTFNMQGGQVNFSGDNPVEGVWIKAPLENLISTVYVAPACPAWVRDLVERVLRKYEVDVPLVQSSLDEEPFF